MSDDAALIARLRGCNPPDRTIPEQRQIAVDVAAAADRIEQLTLERDERNAACTAFCNDRNAAITERDEWRERATHWNDPLGAASLSAHEAKSWRQRAETLECNAKIAAATAADDSRKADERIAYLMQKLDAAQMESDRRTETAFYEGKRLGAEAAIAMLICPQCGTMMRKNENLPADER